MEIMDKMQLLAAIALSSVMIIAIVGISIVLFWDEKPLPEK